MKKYTADTAAKTVLGIELGSTRIKAVLIDEDHQPLASGAYEWENQLVDGVWTYSLDDVWKGLQSCYRELAEEVQEKYGEPITIVGAIGISAMMHGYLVFGKDGNQLVPFRTWRNTITEQAAEKLSSLFQFNIPQRWSIAHLYQAVLNKEPHVGDITHLTTLAGYVHSRLTGERVIGAGEASGMFPVDSCTVDFNSEKAKQFNELMADAGLKIKLEEIFPKVLAAGEPAGVLTEEGARLLDPSGKLRPGIPFCPPEGDAGTGMVATNSVAERTGNISAGTSVFAMIVLAKELSRMYTEIDMVTTPDGKPVAMVHCNNFTSDIDAWIRLLREAAGLFGVEVDKDQFYKTMYEKALEGDPACGGLVSYNYYAGEPITGLEEGRPLFVRMPDGKLNVANFMRTIIFSAMGTLKLGMDILEKEDVQLDKLLGHGGFFKTKGVGQNLMAAALNVPVGVMESAGEGGAWGIALLAAYTVWKSQGETLERYLADKVFGQSEGVVVQPEAKDVQGFAVFMERYTAGLDAERAAVKSLI
ncbi:FGGY-family carbohydrate kinase [Christensenellaceae bacterium OttesenSCG-928-K19]|nr:FGGY-family carbohydrate kinase [Christensenellaceae bacterium OttesenSCG-928-K19]